VSGIELEQSRTGGSFAALRLQVLILCSLTLLGLYAMTFTPYDGVSSRGVWGTDFRLDPKYHVRAALIVVGLLGGAVSLLTLLLPIMLKLIRRRPIERDLPLQASMSLASLCIGWLMFPYWTNGVFQAFAGNREVLARMPVLDFDPKALMPATWFGSSWWLVTFSLAYMTWLGVPLLIVAAIAYGLWTRHWKQAILIIGCLSLIAALLYLSPSFGGWMAD